MTQSATSSPGRVSQIDLMRILAITGVVVIHSISATQPATSVIAAGFLMLTHASRDVFFLLTAFVLQYTAATAPPGSFWRRRYPLVLVPYLCWSLLYVVVSGDLGGSPGAAFSTLGKDLALGWWHLYFLVVTMQFYAVFPALAWLLRRTTGRGHLILLVGAAGFELAETTLLQYHFGLPTAFLKPWSTVFQALLPSHVFWFVAGVVACVHVHELRSWLACHRRTVVWLVALAVVAAEAVYFTGLGAGLPTVAAASPAQPVILLTGVAAVLALWVVGDRLLETKPVQGRFWRGVAFCSDISFGVFLVHVLILVWLVVPLERMTGIAGPGFVSALVAITAVLVVSAVIAVLGRKTPLSLVLTGRPRRPHESDRPPIPRRALIADAVRSGDGQMSRSNWWQRGRRLLVLATTVFIVVAPLVVRAALYNFERPHGGPGDHRIPPARDRGR
jgi:peptidoglycan/LPS O-acetylase OafA/YrhL